MSKQNPIVVVTGSSGAGTTTVKTAFEHIFRRLNVTPCTVEGDSFHRYDRAAMREVIAKARESDENVSHFGPEANLIEELGSDAFYSDKESALRALQSETTAS